MEGTIAIPIEEYKDLLKKSIMVDVFANFVNSTKYSVDREDCGRYLGFDIKDKED